MKRLFSTLAVLTLSFGMLLSAQELMKVNSTDHSVKFNVEASDVISVDDMNVIKIFDLSSKVKVQYYTIPVAIDTVLMPAELTTHKIPVTLDGSWDRGKSWTTITTVDFYGTADTTFNFQDVSTGTSAERLRVKLNGADGDSINVQLVDLNARFLDK